MILARMNDDRCPDQKTDPDADGTPCTGPPPCLRACFRPPPVTAAARLIAHRKRKRAGRAVLRVEVNIHDWSDALVESGLLEGWNAEDRVAIAAATERVVDVLLRLGETRFRAIRNDVR